MNSIFRLISWFCSCDSRLTRWAFEWLLLCRRDFTHAFGGSVYRLLWLNSTDVVDYVVFRGRGGFRLADFSGRFTYSHKPLVMNNDRVLSCVARSAVLLEPHVVVEFRPKEIGYLRSIVLAVAGEMARLTLFYNNYWTDDVFVWKSLTISVRKWASSPKMIFLPKLGLTSNCSRAQQRTRRCLCSFGFRFWVSWTNWP